MTRAEITYRRLDALSRTRALTERESVMLEAAIHKLDGTRPEPEGYEEMMQEGKRWG